MNDREIRKYYTEAIDRPRFQRPFNEGDLKLWKKTMGYADVEDMDKALTWWFNDSTEFPMPVDLKPLIERSRRSRKASSLPAATETRWRCPTCGVTMTGFLSHGAREDRTCPGLTNIPKVPCGEIMSLIWRAA